MVVDARGDFVSQRECASLRHLESRFGETSDSMTLSAPGQAPLDLKIGEGARRLVTVWGDRVDAIDAGDAPAAWLSTWLGKEVRLVSMPPDAERHIDPDFAESADEVVSFADGFPLLLVSQSSVDALGRRMEDHGADAVPTSRFRGNVIVSGAPAFAEDSWTQVRIGEVRFRVAKPCARCVVTTIDQDGQAEGASDSREPLRTLATFRNRPDGVMFGQNLVPRTTGTICVGDAVSLD